MSTQSVYLHDPNCTVHPGCAAAWREWFELHGIPDPNTIRIGSQVEYDDETLTITVERVVPEFPENRVAIENYKLLTPALPMPEWTTT